MPKKSIRGRFFIAVPFDGGSWTCTSDRDRSLTPAQIADSLSEYADFIRRHFVEKPADGPQQEQL